jgi:hypothetical protein
MTRFERQRLPRLPSLSFFVLPVIATESSCGVRSPSLSGQRLRTKRNVYIHSFRV